MPTPKSQYKSDIDGLRAIAVISVIAFHYFPEMFPGGFVGVDVFFVISGFLISRNIISELKSEKFSILHFYSRRIRRILPALIVVLTTTLIAGWYFFVPTTFVALGKHVLGGATFASNILLWKESGYFDTDSIEKPLLHLWSLGVEEQFYFIYPLALWLLWKLKMPLLISIGALAAISFVLNLSAMQVDKVQAFYSPLTRFWELLFGGMLAVATAFSKRKSRKRAASEKSKYEALSTAGFALIVTGVFYFDTNSEFPGWIALLPVSGATLLIFVGKNAWLNERILSNSIMVWIGLISFPLYLWHWVILTFYHLVFFEQPIFLVKIGMIAVSVFLAWLVYVFVEKPIRWGAKPTRNAWILLSMLGAIGLIGAGVYYGKIPAYIEISQVGTDKQGGLKAEAIIENDEGAQPLRNSVRPPATSDNRNTWAASRSKEVVKQANKESTKPASSNVSSKAYSDADAKNRLALVRTSENVDGQKNVAREVSIAEWTSYFETRNYLSLPDANERWRNDCNFYNLDAFWRGQATILPKEISSSCYQREKGKKAVFLWGDSHASQISLAIKKHLPDSWQMLIIASSMCPPAISAADLDNHFCAKSNWVALKKISEVRPEVVVLAREHEHSVASAEALGVVLKDAGVQRVIFLGAAPLWTGYLPDIIAKKFWDTTPKRMLEYVNLARLEQNRLLAQGLANSKNVEFFDVLSRFCNDKGCLVYLGKDRFKGLTSFDGRHLTDAAADFLVREGLMDFIVGKKINTSQEN